MEGDEFLENSVGTVNQLNGNQVALDIYDHAS